MDSFKLYTDRLIIEPFTTADAPFILELVNTPDWKKYISDGGVDDLEKAENYITRALLAQYEQFGFGLYKTNLKDSHTPIGMCGLVKRNYLDMPDLGFAILPTYYRKGYTEEASLAILKYAKEQPKFLERLQ